MKSDTINCLHLMDMLWQTNADGNVLQCHLLWIAMNLNDISQYELRVLCDLHNCGSFMSDALFVQRCKEYALVDAERISHYVTKAEHMLHIKAIEHAFNMMQ